MYLGEEAYSLVGYFIFGLPCITCGFLVIYSIFIYLKKKKKKRKDYLNTYLPIGLMKKENFHGVFFGGINENIHTFHYGHLCLPNSVGSVWNPKNTKKL